MLTLQVQPVTFTYKTINTDSEASHEGRFHLRPLESFFTEREEGGLELSLILPSTAQSQWRLTNQKTNSYFFLVYQSTPPKDGCMHARTDTHTHTHTHTETEL